MEEWRHSERKSVSADCCSVARRRAAPKRLDFADRFVTPSRAASASRFRPRIRRIRPNPHAYSQGRNRRTQNLGNEDLALAQNSAHFSHAP